MLTMGSHMNSLSSVCRTTLEGGKILRKLGIAGGDSVARVGGSARLYQVLGLFLSSMRQPEHTA